MSVTYSVCAMPDLIKIGTETENGVERIAFDASEWLLTWPDMHLSVWAQEPKTDVMYEAQAHRDGAMIVWDVGAQDTRLSGYGAVLVMGETESGERKLSARVRTYIRESGMQATADAPLAQQPWYTGAIEEARKASADAAKTGEAIGKLKDDLDNFYADINGEIDLGDWERGFVSATGVETSNNYTWRTGKIPVSPLAPYKIVVVNHNGYIIRKFNASDEVIGSVSQTGSTSTETIEKTIWINDDGISYIRMCVTSQDNTNYPANGENVSLFLSANEQYCRNYGEVTPEMFGAVGDGTTNDTTALQACIDYAALNGISVKSVKGRKYKVTQITIDKPVDIDLGWATIVSGNASSTVIVNRTTNAAYGNTRVNGTLRRVIFDGNLVSNGILYISNDIRGVYEDLIIQNMGKKVSSSGRTDEDKGTENLSRGIVYAAKPGKGGGNYFRRIYGQMQPNYGSYDTLLIDVMGSDSTFQNIDYQHIKYGIRITGGAFVDNFHGYITGSSIYPGSYCMRVGKNGFVIASQYYPDTQQYGTIVNNDGKPVIINGGVSYFSPDSEIATSGAVSEFPPYLFYGANSDQLKGVNVCGMYFNAPADDNGEPYTYTLCNVDTQLKIINSVYNNIIGAQE